MLSRVLDFLLPPECPICREAVTEAHTLCLSCFSKLDFIHGAMCEDCGFPLPDTEFPRCMSCMAKEPPFQKARSGLIYNDYSKEMLLKLKHCDRLDLARPLARLIYPQVREILEKSDGLVPVPLHRKRLWKRRFNQATLIAQELASTYKQREGTSIDMLTNVLSRQKETAVQGQSRKARFTNVQGAFAVRDQSSLAGKRIAIVDDVYTTGATVKACAKALKRAGVKDIYVITAARVIYAQDLLEQ